MSSSRYVPSPSPLQTTTTIRRRKCSFSNVIRPNSETDTIKVITQEEVVSEQVESVEKGTFILPKRVILILGDKKIEIPADIIMPIGKEEPVIQLK